MKIKRNIRLLYAVSFLQGMVFYSSVSTLYRKSAGITVFQISIIESVSLLLSLALELPWGILSEKIGYKRTMVICSIFYFVSKLIFWRADGFGMFLTERVLLAVVCAGYSGVDSSVLYLSCEESEAQKVFGVYEGMGTAGMLAASGIYSMFLAGQYRKAALWTAGSYGLAMFGTFFLAEVKPKEMAGDRRSALGEFREIWRDVAARKRLLLFLAGTALFAESHQYITVFLNQLQYVRIGMSDRLIGVVYIFVTVAGLVGVRSDHLTRILGKRKTGSLLLAAGAVSCLLLAVTKSMWISVLAVLLLRVSCSLFLPLAETLENVWLTYKNRATALSICAILTDAVSVGVELILGKAGDVSLLAAFGLGAVFCLIGLWCFCVQFDSQPDNKNRLRLFFIA